jgi:hypothetical protein
MAAARHASSTAHAASTNPASPRPDPEAARSRPYIHGNTR